MRSDALTKACRDNRDKKYRERLFFLSLFPLSIASIIASPCLSELPTHARNKSSVSLYRGIYFRNCAAIVVLEHETMPRSCDRDRSPDVVPRMRRGFPNIPLRGPGRAITSFSQSIATLACMYVTNRSTLSRVTHISRRPL